jgi:hypothetical protein
MLPIRRYNSTRWDTTTLSTVDASLGRMFHGTVLAGTGEIVHQSGITCPGYPRAAPRGASVVNSVRRWTTAQSWVHSAVCLFSCERTLVFLYRRTRG